MSSLSTVVSSLVRASMGSAVPGSVTDEDLDRHVAEVILREAREKAVRYDKDGIRAYLHNGSTPESSAPRANKRFLSSIIRSTDDHNKTVLRAQALAAQEIKLARELLERKERRRRPMRGFSDGESGQDDDDDGETEPSVKRRKYRSRSPSASRERSEKRYSGNDDDWRLRRARESRGESRKGGSSSSSSSNSNSNNRRLSEKGVVRARARTESPGESHDVSDERERRRRRKRASRNRHDHHRTRRRSSRSLSPARRSRSPPLDARDIERPRIKSHLRSSPPRSSSTPAYTEKTVLSNRNRSRSRSPTGKHPDTLRHGGESNGRHQRPGSGGVRGLTVRTTPSSRAATPNTGLGKSSQHRAQVMSKAVSSTTESQSCPPSPSPPSHLSPLPSKMDKYFEESYDPRLDVAALTMPKVPTTGLIDESQFEGWDAMLELIRLRKQDRHERKRLEKLTGGGGKGSKKGGVIPVAEDKCSSSSLMEIEYKKRGSVREWDIGKKSTR